MSSPVQRSPAGPHGALPGFIAVAADGPCILDDLGATAGVSVASCGPTTLFSWGLDALPGPAGAAQTPAFALSRVRRTDRSTVPPASIADAMRVDPGALTHLLPPFAAVAGDAAGVTMVADSMGFRQLFHGGPDTGGAPVLSTSALLAGRGTSAELDETAVAVQSLLGWQLGQRTLSRGVHKLVDGGVARLGAQGVRIDQPERAVQEPISLDDAVVRAAEMLRTSLNALLDDHPDAVLQLTGGQDSRLLLSAIPVSRRKGLGAMTLGNPDSGDVTVAGELAERYGLRHEVHDFAALEKVSPEEAWALTVDAAVRLDAMSDPIAFAALAVAERRFDQGVRISGLGGEIARGFYYVGAVHARSFTRRDAEQLGGWRMFVNEAVEPGMLDRGFADWARQTADDEVVSVLAGAGEEWFRATDELYLRHRMQRWAGATDTAVGEERVVINPMLCQQFLSIASRLAPEDKAHSRFLARLQMELDPDLGRIALEGRAAPVAMAHPTPWRSASGAVGTGRRFVRKVTQRIRRGNRPPAGGSMLAAKVVEHWRDHPELLAAAEFPAIVRPGWTEDVLAGRLDPRPSSVAFLANLTVAARASSWEGANARA